MGEGTNAMGEGTKKGGDQAFRYEPVERFGEGLTTSRPWNLAALAGVERLNGRVAMLGFVAALIGEELTGKGALGQLALMLRWLLG
ncbi:chlorophyll a/b-binding protein [Synechococcus sp. CS-1332]|uniref:chlorophyll a/b-binding protein n=1 Tax=Synechococcus sp. CS-1332 TaxID=2847972 RepID=UPI00223B8252|nr:chlorophyll a/b-binding protein [Synechococcus sp. CS-1332]